MPGSTPNFELPYPLVGEPPAGHTNIQDVAMAVDGALNWFGTWVTYTPTVSGILTVGNGVLEGRWTQIGQTVIGMARCTLGTTSTVTGSGYVGFSLPLAPASQSNLTSTLSMLYDLSADGAYVGIAWLQGTNAHCYAWPNAAGKAQNITSTVPFTWTGSDMIQATFLYRAA